MSSLNVIQRYRDLTAAVLATCLFPGLLNANEFYEGEILTLDLDHIQSMGLLPVGMMDDEALYTAAEAARMHNGFDEQFSINLIWLFSNNINTQKVRGQFKKKVVSNIWRYLKCEGNSCEKSSVSEKRLKRFSKKYRFKLRHNEVSLQIVKKF